METLLVKFPPQHWNEQTRKELALQLYRQGFISYADARQLAGMRKILVSPTSLLAKISSIANIPVGENK